MSPPTVRMVLWGGPGDGAEVRVMGAPLPEWLTWWQSSPDAEPQVRQAAFRPPAGDRALYRLDRFTLRYLFLPPTA